VRSCITLAVASDDRRVTTIDGITPDEGLSPLQAAFQEARGLQCGFCTPGLLLTLASADPDEHPDDAAIRELLAGHLCRCTGYAAILAAVRRAWGRPEG
jgi:carbon-monoxide dehydrogenase small subunit